MSTSNGRGRKKKPGPAKIVIRLDEVRKLAPFLTIKLLCEYFGISETTWRRRCTENPKILAAYQRARAKKLNDVAGNLYQIAMGDTKQAVTAAIFILKTQAQWKETAVLEVHEHPLAGKEKPKTLAEARERLRLIDGGKSS